MDPNFVDENKIRHLEFIQNIISRLNSNSFMIKGWAITIVSAVLALLATTSNKAFIAITGLPIIVFWVLDSFYLQTERKYAILYGKIIEPSSNIPPFNLNINSPEVTNERGTSYFASFFSRTIKVFYLSLLIVSAVCTFFISRSGEGGMMPVEVNLKANDTIKVKTIDPKYQITIDTAR